jgi:hypothetical protein
VAEAWTIVNLIVLASLGLIAATWLRWARR